MLSIYMLLHFFTLTNAKEQLEWLLGSTMIGEDTAAIATEKDIRDYMGKHIDEKAQKAFQENFDVVMQFNLPKAMTGLVAHMLIFAKSCCSYSAEKYHGAIKLIVNECACQGLSIQEQDIHTMVKSLKALSDLFEISPQQCSMCKV